MPFAFNRRWFRFSLRTLFVGMTLLGGWLGYEVNWLRERHAMLAAREAWVLEGSTPHLSLAALQAHLPPEERGPATAPGGLWLFGEQGVTELRVFIPNFDQARTCESYEVSMRASRLFPESILSFMCQTPNPPIVPLAEPGTQSDRENHRGGECWHER